MPKSGPRIALVVPLVRWPKKTKPVCAPPSWRGFRRFETATTPNRIANVVSAEPRCSDAIGGEDARGCAPCVSTQETRLRTERIEARPDALVGGMIGGMLVSVRKAHDPLAVDHERAGHLVHVTRFGHRDLAQARQHGPEPFHRARSEELAEARPPEPERRVGRLAPGGG